MPRFARFATGSRIENHFLDTLEIIYQAYYSTLEKKSDRVVLAIGKVDLIKFLLQTAYENRDIKQSHYHILSDKLHEVGKMLGGWKNNIDAKQDREKQKPAQR